MIGSHLRRTSLLLLVVGVLVGLSGAPASAQTKVRQDARGDAPSFVDLTSVKVQNNARNLAVTTRFAEVRARRTEVFVVFEADTGDRADGVDLYSVFSSPVGRGRYVDRLAVFRTAADESVVLDCPGLRSTWTRGDRGSHRLVVPQSCLGPGAGRQRLTVIATDRRDDDGFFFAFRQGRRGDAVGPIDQLDRTVTVRRGR